MKSGETIRLDELIIIEDDVLIGTKVNLVTENHPLDSANRRARICKPIVIKRIACLGAAAPTDRRNY